MTFFGFTLTISDKLRLSGRFHQLSPKHWLTAESSMIHAKPAPG
jgi:hypothetical protein